MQTLVVWVAALLPARREPHVYRYGMVYSPVLCDSFHGEPRQSKIKAEGMDAIQGRASKACLWRPVRRVSHLVY